MNHYYLSFILCSIIGFNCSDFQGSKEIPVIPQVKVSEKVKAETLRYPIYTSTDQGLSWNPIALNLSENTQVSFLKDFGNELLIATDNNGLFLTSDNISTSKHISSTLPNQKINALHVFENEIYVGVYRQGVFVSKDGGKSWKSLNENLPDLRVQAILKIENKLLLGTDTGVFVSEDNENWKSVFSEAQIVSMNESNGKIVAGASMGTLLSNDKGKTWKWIHEVGAAHSTVIIDEAIIIMNISGDLFRSKDWGNSWQEFFYRPREASYVYDVIGLDQFLIISNNYGIHKSIGGDSLWNLVYPIEDAAFYDFHYKNNILYGGTRSWNEWRNRK